MTPNDRSAAERLQLVEPDLVSFSLALLGKAGNVDEARVMAVAEAYVRGDLVLRNDQALTAARREGAQSAVDVATQRLVDRFCTCGGGKHRPSWTHCKGHDALAVLDALASDASVPEPPTEAGPLETVHIVEFSEDGYGLQHPQACRPDLIGCQYNEWLRTQLAPDREPGRYIMTLANNNPVYTPAPQPSEQEERT